VGKAAVSALKKRAKPSPGVYINTAHLDTLLLDDLRAALTFPSDSETCLSSMQVEEKEQKNDEPLPGWGNFVKATFDEIAAQETIDRDTVEWRSQFMKNIRAGPRRMLRIKSTSTAKNRAALASRWAQEGKIFAVKYEGSSGIRAFPVSGWRASHHNWAGHPGVSSHANGWDFAYFFATPNANIGGGSLSITEV